MANDDTTGCCDPADLVGDLTGARSSPPLIAEGVELCSFPVIASFAKMSGLCDRYLNDPAPAAPQWHPVSNVLYIQLLKYDRLASEPYADFGFIRQNELIFQIPIVDTDSAPWRFGVFFAWLAVDHPTSLVVGREVYGFPKNLGTFTRNAGTGAVGVTTWLTPVKSAATPVGEHPLLSITGLKKFPSVVPNFLQAETGAALWPYGPVRTLFERPREEEPYIEIDEKVRTALFAHVGASVPVSTWVQALKEIDSTTVIPGGPQQAAYQARLSSLQTLTAVRGSGAIALNSLRIQAYDPLDLKDIFGIWSLPGGNIPVFSPFWIEFDSRMEPPEILTCHC